MLFFPLVQYYDLCQGPATFISIDQKIKGKVFLLKFFVIKDLLPSLVKQLKDTYYGTDSEVRQPYKKVNSKI